MTGIITDGDKELLKGEKEHTSSRAKEQQRIRLRRRVRESIADFPFLLSYLNQEDYNSIFQPRSGDREGIAQSTISAIAFFFHGIENSTEYNFNSIIENAKQQAEFEQKQITKITGKCSNCGATLGMELSEPANAALLSGVTEGICSKCGETGDLSPADQ